MNLHSTGPARNSLPANQPPTIFIVDEDPASRESLELLTRSAGWQPRSACSAEEFLALPRLRTASCMLAEFDLPGLRGIELQRIVSDRPEMPIIFVTDRADVQTAVQAMKAGAFELLPKPIETERVLQSARHAIERSVVAIRQRTYLHSLQQRFGSLTPREREVLRLVCNGHLNKQVAAQLGISEITVKAHRGRAMQKMKARSIVELADMARHLGMPLVIDSRRTLAEDIAPFDALMQTLDLRTLNHFPAFSSQRVIEPLASLSIA